MHLTQKHTHILLIALCVFIASLFMLVTSVLYGISTGQVNLLSTQEGPSSYSELLKLSEGRDSIMAVPETLHASAGDEDGSGLIMPDLPPVRVDRE